MPLVLPADATTTRARRLFWLLMGLCWVSYFYFLNDGADFEPTDCWVAQTAREMRESPDWKGYIIPHFSGEVRMQKSPGPYWAVIAASWLRGSPVDVPSTRIPNGLAAMLLVATIFWLTRRIAGDRAAIYAGYASASSLFLLYWSHRGASDLGVTAFMTVSLASIWIGSECETGWRRIGLWMLGYFAAGLAMLYKMPMPLVCVGLPAVAYVLICRRWKILLSPWHLLGLILFCVPWLPWVIALATLQMPGSEAGATTDFFTTLHKWRVEFIDRFTGDLPNIEGQKTDWRMYFLYIGVAFVFAFPYSLSIPAAIGRAFRRAGIEGQIRNGILFLAIWVLSLFVFFTYTPGKETRYFLPAMPPLLALLGIELAHFFDPKRAGNTTFERIAPWLAGPLVMAGAGGGIYALYRISKLYGDYAVFPFHAVWPPVAIAAGVFVLGAFVSSWLFAMRRRDASFGALAATMFCTWLWVWPKVMPIMANEKPFIDFAAQLRDKIPPELHKNMYQIAQQDSRVIWYSDVRYPRIIDQLELLRMQGGKRSRATEERIVAETMINKLHGPDLALLVADPETYVRFHSAEAAQLMREHGYERPRTYVWITANYGRPDHRYVLFGNRPPPWPEPRLALPEKVQMKIDPAHRALSSRPASNVSGPPDPVPASNP